MNTRRSILKGLGGLVAGLVGVKAMAGGVKAPSLPATPLEAVKRPLPKVWHDLCKGGVYKTEYPGDYWKPEKFKRLPAPECDSVLVCGENGPEWVRQRDLDGRYVKMMTGRGSGEAVVVDGRFIGVVIREGHGGQYAVVQTHGPCSAKVLPC